MEWRVSGRYFEACSCEVVCPCRRIDGSPGGRSTYGVCHFALGWSIDSGTADDLDLSGFEVVMAGSYDDDEPGSPWRVVLYVDARATGEQQRAMEAIYLGRAGGTTLTNFAAAIRDVLAVRPARISIEHSPGGRSIRVGDYVEVVERAPFATEEAISCCIPGHDHPGEEVFAELLAVRDGGLEFEVRGRCGFAARYDYGSDA